MWEVGTDGRQAGVGIGGVEEREIDREVCTGKGRGEGLGLEVGRVVWEEMMWLHGRGRTSVGSEGEGCGREGILLVRVRERFGYEQGKGSYESGERNIVL